MLSHPRTFPLLLATLTLLVTGSLFADGWSQHAGNARHTGNVSVSAQALKALLADLVYDPFVAAEMDETGGDLLVHYQVPLVEGDDVYMEFKGGTFVGSDHWETQSWSIHALRWNGAGLVERWVAPSDWKPVPPGAVGFEPVFHAALSGSFLYEPAFGGTVLQVDRQSGGVIQRINPFGVALDPSIFVAGPITADASGNIYYTAIRLNLSAPWTTDSTGAWLVRVKSDGTTTAIPFSTLVTGAPQSSDPCLGAFRSDERPWPPSAGAVPDSIPCGRQRPGINAAPAVGPDGTIYFVSKAHFNSYYSYLVAVSSDLTPKWSASMRNLFHDGCGVFVPFGNQPFYCRPGTATGVDPSQNLPGAGRVNDSSTSSPVVAPDGTIYYGSFTSYNDGGGHLVHYSAAGVYLGAYRFGWDTTPAIYPHDGTFSLVTKENRYGGVVTPRPEYYITQLSPDLEVEWQLQSTATDACGRDPHGEVICVPEQADGFEWCVNAPAVDAHGTVYVNSEDGNLYAISQGGVVTSKIFLQLALGAGYTPVSIGPEGRVYAQNAGHLFVVGEGARRRIAGH
jgi:outer membrane protein assembly factor BamB